jgi:hypothetical protein
MEQQINSPQPSAGEKIAIFCETLAGTAVVAEAWDVARVGISGACTACRRNRAAAEGSATIDSVKFVNFVGIRGQARLGSQRAIHRKMTPTRMTSSSPCIQIKGLGQFLNAEQQRAWLEGELTPRDADERDESLEHRFKYVARFEKLLRRPQAQDVLELVRLYGETCIPVPRRTERYFWSVSCLPSTSDKPLVRVNASWMELFTLLPEGDGIRARFIVHLADFTMDGSGDPDRIDEAFLEQCVERPEDVSHVLWHRPRILIVKVRGAASIRAFMSDPRALRAIRNFNLTHMNRGRNAYQASHCYSVADVMLGE